MGGIVPIGRALVAVVVVAIGSTIAGFAYLAIAFSGYCETCDTSPPSTAGIVARDTSCLLIVYCACLLATAVLLRGYVNHGGSYGLGRLRFGVIAVRLVGAPLAAGYAAFRATDLNTGLVIGVGVFALYVALWSAATMAAYPRLARQTPPDA